MRKKAISILMILALSPALLLAEGYGRDGWFHHMGNGWGGHMGFMGGGWLMMILWIGLILFALIGLARWATGSRNKAAVSADVDGILNERFAKGEISREQLEEMKKILK